MTVWVQATYIKASPSLTFCCSRVRLYGGDASSRDSPQVSPARSHSLEKGAPLSHWNMMQLLHIHHVFQCSSFLCPETEECHLKMLLMLKRHYILHSLSNTFFSVFFELHCGWTITYVYAQCIWASAQIAWNSLNTMINYRISLYLFLHSCKQASVFLELIYFMSHTSMRRTHLITSTWNNVCLTIVIRWKWSHLS